MHDLSARVGDLMAEAMVLAERGDTCDLATLELLHRDLEHLLEGCDDGAAVADGREVLAQIVIAVRLDRGAPRRLALAS